MLRYIDLTTLCDITFTWFLVSWFVTRHVLFVLVVIRSTYVDFPRFIPFIWAPKRDYYSPKIMWIIYLTLLCALQVIHDSKSLALIRIDLAFYRWYRFFGSCWFAVWHGGSCVVLAQKIIAAMMKGQCLYPFFILFLCSLYLHCSDQEDKKDRWSYRQSMLSEDNGI